MRYATSCVVCAGQLPARVRADCRYCGVRCRVRAYRIRCDGGGRFRSDAQRRESQEVRRALREARDLAAEQTGSAAALREWADLLESEEATLRSECQQLRRQLHAAQQEILTHREALHAHEQEAAQLRTEAAAELAAVQHIAQQAQDELRHTREALRAAEAALREEKEATAERNAVVRRLHGAMEQAQAEINAAKLDASDASNRATDSKREAERLAVVVEKQRREIHALRQDDEKVIEERQESRRTKQRLEKQLADASRAYADVAAQRDECLHEIRILQARAASRQNAPQRANETHRLKQELLESQEARRSLHAALEESAAKLVQSERERVALADNANRLRSTLTETQASLKKWKSQEISEIGVAVAKEAGRIGLGAVLATIRNEFIKDLAGIDPATDDPLPRATSPGTSPGTSPRKADDLQSGPPQRRR